MKKIWKLIIKKYQYVKPKALIEMLNELNDKSSLTSISTLPDTVSWGL